MTFLPVGMTTYHLQSSISSTATTIILSSLTEPVSGTLLTMAYMGSTIQYMTIEPRTSNSEFISFTTITQNADGTATLTGVTRGLQRVSPYTNSSTFQVPHAGGSQIIFGDSPQVFVNSMLATNNTWTGTNTFSSNVLLSGASGSLGYTTGSGSSVVQATNKSTGVTLNTPNGQITMNNASLAASTTVSFTLTNSVITANDVLILNHISGGTAGSYTLNAQCTAGSASINVRNVSLGSLSEAILIQYALIQSAIT